MSNDKAALLKQLRDVHLPAPIGYWPPAVGWYIVAAGLILLGSYVIYRMLQTRKKYRVRRAALQKLLQLRQQPPAKIIPELAILLKQTALAYYPRQLIAGLHGQDWLKFLDATSGGKTAFQHSGNTLMTAPYQASPPANIVNLLDMAKLWLQQQPKKINGTRYV